MSAFCSPSHRTCDECPWRKDVPAGKFPASRFEALRHTSTGADRLKPIFACHKTSEGKDLACVGYLMVGATSNIAVRIAAAQHRFDPDRLTAGGPLFSNFEEMAVANGCAPAPEEESDDLQHQHAAGEMISADMAARIGELELLLRR